MEAKEIPLSIEDILRDYVDIEQASVIFGKVSVRTAYRYIAELSKQASITVKVVDQISNGGVKKYYLKEHIIAMAKIKNRGKVAIVYETVDVTPSEPIRAFKQSGKEQLSDKLAITVKMWQRVPTVKFVVGALILNVLVTAGVVLAATYCLVTIQSKLLMEITSLKTELRFSEFSEMFKFDTIQTSDRDIDKIKGG